VFSAKGADHASLGQRPRKKFSPKPALKARINLRQGSIDERHVCRWIALSALIEFFLTKPWGVAPGWYKYRAVGANRFIRVKMTTNELSFQAALLVGKLFWMS
jgi:hypothetical protein